MYVSGIEGLSNLTLPGLFIFQGSKDCRNLHCLICLCFRDRRTVEPYIALFVYVSGIERPSNLTLHCLCIFQGSKDCRTLHCPTAQRPVKRRCVPIVDNWNNFYVFLMLAISIPDLETEQLNATIRLAQSLTRQNSFWPGWTVSRMFACHKESLSGTFISVTMYTRVTQSSPNKFLETISQLINRPLKVTINNKEHILKQSHHKHLYTRVQMYDNTGFDFCRNNIDDTFNFFAPKMPVASLGLVNASSCTYCQQVFEQGDWSYLIITELYYCNQVVFNESEFTFVGDSIYVPGIRRCFTI